MRFLDGQNATVGIHGCLGSIVITTNMLVERGLWIGQHDFSTAEVFLTHPLATETPHREGQTPNGLIGGSQYLDFWVLELVAELDQADA